MGGAIVKHNHSCNIGEQTVHFPVCMWCAVWSWQTLACIRKHTFRCSLCHKGQATSTHTPFTLMIYLSECSRQLRRLLIYLNKWGERRETCKFALHMHYVQTARKVGQGTHRQGRVGLALETDVQQIQTSSLYLDIVHRVRDITANTSMIINLHHTSCTYTGENSQGQR